MSSRSEAIAVAGDVWEELVKHVVLTVPHSLEARTVFHQRPRQVAKQWDLPHHRSRAGALGG